MYSKEKEDQEIQNDRYLIEFMECVEFKHVSADEMSKGRIWKQAIA